jgi:hypothetical protein
MSTQPRVFHLTTPQDDEAPVCRHDNRVDGLYWNDLHKSRRHCQKKKDFVLSECTPPRCDPGKKTNTPGTTAPAQ